jgi:glycine dehydrogenase
VDEKIWPNTLAVLRTRAAGQDIEIVTGNYADFQPTADFFGALVQWPNSDGSIEDYEAFIDDCHEAGLKVTVVADLMALVLLKPLNADIPFGLSRLIGDDIRLCAIFVFRLILRGELFFCFIGMLVAFQ